MNKVVQYLLLSFFVVGFIQQRAIFGLMSAIGAGDRDTAKVLLIVGGFDKAENQKKPAWKRAVTKFPDIATEIAAEKAKLQESLGVNLKKQVDEMSKDPAKGFNEALGKGTKEGLQEAYTILMTDKEKGANYKALKAADEKQADAMLNDIKSVLKKYRFPGA